MAAMPDDTAGGGPAPALSLLPYVGSIVSAWVIVTLLAYGVLRQLYAHFYGTLGTSPEEVGLDSTQVLTVAAIPFIALTAAVAGVHRFAAAVIASGRHRTGRTVFIVTWVAVVVGLVAVAAVLGAGTKAATDAAYSGQRVSSVNVGPIQVLALRAEPVIVTWTGPVPSTGPPIESGRCYLYLGQANDEVVLFDPGPSAGASAGSDIETVRVEARMVTLAVSRGAHLPGQPARVAHPSCVDHQLRFR